jgi:hypothetical protein
MRTPFPNLMAFHLKTGTCLYTPSKNYNTLPGAFQMEATEKKSVPDLTPERTY